MHSSSHKALCPSTCAHRHVPVREGLTVHTDVGGLVLTHGHHHLTLGGCRKTLKA
ncbi:hypothetical protein DPMN_128696 [Dreissena polymorpha]|uniref:Uncharacterized protein n=1 Tax=Dreissena polymorpha TaxID=45954 RepID=A0A9D4H4F6_DREPO|nr:hypothetical protein DPMN_128696 [Dreissena polymorpha]